MDLLLEKEESRVARYRRKHKSLGLCVNCPLSAEPGHIYCKDHIKKHRIRNIIQGKNRRENNLCFTCSAPLHEDMDKGFSNCIFCRERTGNFLRKTER